MNYDDNEKKLGVTSSSLHFLIQPLINSCELKLATRSTMCRWKYEQRDGCHSNIQYSLAGLDKWTNHAAL